MDSRIFRGKHDIFWIYGYYVVYPNKNNYIIDYQDGKEHSVIPETVGRSTGKIDLKGRYIFEHDIYFSEEEEEHGDVRYHYVCVWVKEWSRFIWLHIDEYKDYLDNGVENLEKDYLMCANTFGLNVEFMHYAGNIFENAHLLD